MVAGLVRRHLFEDLRNLLRIPEKGVGVNMQGWYYGDVPQAASLFGAGAVMRILLDQGAGVHVLGGEYGNALQASGFQNIAKIEK